MKLYFIIIFVIVIIAVVAFAVLIINIGLAIHAEGLKNRLFLSPSA